MTMPDGSGLDVLRHVRAHAADVDVIAITSVRDAGVVRQVVALGAAQYLVKPFTFATFHDRMEQYRAYRERARATSGAATQSEIDAMLGRCVRRARSDCRRGCPPRRWNGCPTPSATAADSRRPKPPTPWECRAWQPGATSSTSPRPAASSARPATARADGRRPSTAGDDSGNAPPVGTVRSGRVVVHGHVATPPRVADGLDDAPALLGGVAAHGQHGVAVEDRGENLRVRGVRAEAEVGLERRTVQGERLVTPLTEISIVSLSGPSPKRRTAPLASPVNPSGRWRTGRRTTSTSARLAARAFPERRVNGTPAHRAFRTSTRTWASVSVSRAGSTPGSSTYDGIRSSPAVPAV
jgi:CheY-like chemotaxis protein